MKAFIRTEWRKLSIKDAREFSVSTPRRPSPRLGSRRLARRFARYGAGLALAAAALVAGGCRQDMHDAPRYEPLEQSEFFMDGKTAREPVAGTIARGRLSEDVAYDTGKTESGALVRALPMAVTPELLARGRERYNIFCSPCHDQVGTGMGMIVRRGYKQPQTFHSDRLREAEAGYFFDVITNGFGQMPSYAPQVPVEDRWAIAAYIQALQLSQNAHLADLEPADRSAVREAAAAPAAPAHPAAPAGHGDEAHEGTSSDEH